MRILFISAFYPPYVIGGWEQLVQDVNTRLQARGHTTHVLTSTYGYGTKRREPGVDRLLSLESELAHYNPLDFFLGHKRRLKRNLAHVQETINAFKPTVIFVHVMWNLSRGIPWLAEQLRPGRVVYYIANDWPYTPNTHTNYWRDPAQRLTLKVPKRLLAPIPLKIIDRETKAFTLKFEQVLCVSHKVKENLSRYAGIAPKQMRVIYNGVETDRFVLSESRLRWNGKKLSLLYAGSLVKAKGVHTTIEAMAIAKTKLQHVTLTLVGSGHPDYEAHLKELVEKHNLEDRVHFYGRVSRDEMPELMQKFDVLVFPSTGEALPRVVQEAMATGLVVVGTTAGGTGEILIEGETGLTFNPGDAMTLAKQIERLSGNPELYVRLVQNARDMVIRKCDIRRMIDEIETYLTQVGSARILTDDCIDSTLK